MISSSRIYVIFRVLCNVNREDIQVKLTGNIPALGNWDPRNSLVKLEPTKSQRNWFEFPLEIPHHNLPLE